MIGELPKSLEVGGVSWEIRSDFRPALDIMAAFVDPELSDAEKSEVMLTILYRDFDKIPQEHYAEAAERAVWYLDCGRVQDTSCVHPRVFDWEQDEQIIFPAVNKVAGYETRSVEYLHWWSFMGFFMEVGDGLFSTVVGIRQKKAKGKKLEKWEQEFYRNNKRLVDLEKRYTEEEQAEIDRLNKMLG